MAETKSKSTIILKDELKKIIEAKLKKEMENEFDNAVKRFNERKGEIVAGVLVYIMGMAEMEIAKDRVIFTIKNQDKLN